ncbi:universal stress protein [Salegentibacter chungangensis]|uniref:Universal stress protein n=1 Tax=Salegentibacter chungangensis TaxID=1335724 RepID=A0ABW3NRF8_9FLAO
MKNILIPTDFSQCARHATNYGLELAKKLKSQVTFLHLVPTPVDWDKLPLEKENLYPETKAAIGEVKDSLLKLERQAEKTGVEASSNLIYNRGLDNIQSFIKKDNYDLVIMGTHGVHGFQKLIGSNTQRLIKTSPVPVLAVKTDDKSEVPKKIVIASDFSQKSLSAFGKLIEIAKKLELDIQLLYVNLPYNFRESDDIDYLIDQFINHHPEASFGRNVINANNVSRGVAIYLNKAQPDIIACITHGYSGIAGLFTPGITENIMNHFNLPVLSINMNVSD